jgi:hypothetical protein
MSAENVLGSVSYYGSFAWVYGIREDLWKAAVRSYIKNRGALSKPHIVTLIDYRIPSDQPRLWTLGFMLPMPVILCRTLVAHGKGSSGGDSKIVTAVSNKTGSNQSCAGGFVTLHTYQSGLGQKDSSKQRPALVLDGLDPSNSKARSRGIRMHGAWYVYGNRCGQSHGCICCKQDVHEDLIKIIGQGSFMFSYFGEDSVEV